MSGRLEELPQQPEDTERAGTKDLPGSLGKMAMVTIDPSRGTVLDATLQTNTGSPKWIPDSIRSLMSTEVDVAIIGLLLVSSIWAFAVAIERWQYYRRVDINRFLSRSELETELTRNLTVIGTVAANAPFVGLLGTVLGIMMTFHKMSTEKGMDVHSIMVGLSVALKATAMGLLVAIPCVVLNNVLRRRIRELVTAYEVQVGS
jgi:biopolymer transport protein ExbB